MQVDHAAKQESWEGQARRLQGRCCCLFHQGFEKYREQIGVQMPQISTEVVEAARVDSDCEVDSRFAFIRQ